MFNSLSTGLFKTEGIGLGLTSARTLTQSIQGAIHLNSQENAGTEVGFSIFCKSGSNRVNSKELKEQLAGLRDSIALPEV